jgi:hypothetical protein
MVRTILSSSRIVNGEQSMYDYFHYKFLNDLFHALISAFLAISEIGVTDGFERFPTVSYGSELPDTQPFVNRYEHPCDFLNC